VVPICDLNGKSLSLQHIDAAGGKMFSTDGRVRGGCHVIADGTLDSAEIIVIGEGYATLATIFEATGHACIVAFNSGNLPTIAKAVRERYPAARLIIAADDDHLARDAKGNPHNTGRTKGRQAAVVARAHLAVPNFGDNRSDKHTDFNDLYRAAGDEHDVVCAQIDAALEAPICTAATGPSPHRFALTRLRDLKLSTAPRCLVEDLLPRGGLVLVWGAPKCGKTFWVFDLVGHIALGRPYCGRAVERGLIVYIGCEGEHGLNARGVAFRQERAAAEDPPFHLLVTRLDLVTDIDALIIDIRAQTGGEQPVCVVIDTLNRSIRGSESNDQDMSAYVGAADRLRTDFADCTVILIHHCGINGDRPRGHTSLTGAIDAQFAVVKVDLNAPSFVVTLELMKDGPGGDKAQCRLVVVDLGEDDRGKTITSCVVEHLGTVEGGVKSRPKLPASVQVALRMLHEAILTGGEVPPASNHIPAHTRCITEALWRQYAYDGGIAAGDDATQEAKRKAFKRAVPVLISAGYVGTWGDLFWLTSNTTAET
jgi:hypothetical protein